LSRRASNSNIRAERGASLHRSRLLEPCAWCLVWHAARRAVPSAWGPGRGQQRPLHSFRCQLAHGRAASGFALSVGERPAPPSLAVASWRRSGNAPAAPAAAPPGPKRAALWRHSHTPRPHKHPWRPRLLLAPEWVPQRRHSRGTCQKRQPRCAWGLSAPGNGEFPSPAVGGMWSGEVSEGQVPEFFPEETCAMPALWQCPALTPRTESHSRAHRAPSWRPMDLGGGASAKRSKCARSFGVQYCEKEQKTVVLNCSPKGPPQASRSFSDVARLFALIPSASRTAATCPLRAASPPGAACLRRRRRRRGAQYKETERPISLRHCWFLPLQRSDHHLPGLASIPGPCPIALRQPLKQWHQ